MNDQARNVFATLLVAVIGGVLLWLTDFGGVLRTVLATAGILIALGIARRFPEAKGIATAVIVIAVAMALLPEVHRVLPNRFDVSLRQRTAEQILVQSERITPRALSAHEKTADFCQELDRQGGETIGQKLDAVKARYASDLLKSGKAQAEIFAKLRRLERMSDKCHAVSAGDAHHPRSSRRSLGWNLLLFALALAILGSAYSLVSTRVPYSGLVSLLIVIGLACVFFPSLPRRGQDFYGEFRKGVANLPSSGVSTSVSQPSAIDTTPTPEEWAKIARETPHGEEIEYRFIVDSEREVGPLQIAGFGDGYWYVIPLTAGVRLWDDGKLVWDYKDPFPSPNIPPSTSVSFVAKPGILYKLRMQRK